MYRGVWYTGAINEEEGERYADGGYAGNAEKLLPEGAGVPTDGAISAPCAADLLPGDVGGIAALDRTGLIDYYGGEIPRGRGPLPQVRGPAAEVTFYNRTENTYGKNETAR